MPAQQLYLPRSGSQETLEAEDILGSDHPPPSPLFDIDDFVSDSTSLHPMATTVSPIELTQGLISHRDGSQAHPWASWNGEVDLFHGISANQVHSTPSPFPSSMLPNTMGTLGSYASSSPSSSHPTPQTVLLKTQEAMFNTPQALLSSLYSSPQPPPSYVTFGAAPQGSYPSTTGVISDYELALSGTGMIIGNGAELFHMSTIDHQQMNGVHYPEVGKLPHGDSVYGQTHQSFYRSEGHSYPSSHADIRADQRRPYLPRRDSSVPPFSTEARNAQSNTVFAASAPTPSILSNLSSFSPVGSPRSVRGLSVSITGSSPSLEPASPRYGYPGSPTAPYTASPAQLSASPHQFTSTSPVFASATPITFVNQTAQYSASAWSEDAQLSSAPESSATDDSQSRKRRRRHPSRTTDQQTEERADE
ncbi:hypothetical protein FRC17_008557, partial [Serendipita sp. 399]